MRVDIQILKPIFLALILLSLCTYGFFNYLYKPMQDRGRELELQIREKEKELEETRQIVANLDIKKAEFRRVKKELEYVIKRLPTEKEIPELLRTITQLAVNSNIELISFKPETHVVREVYEEIPVNLLIQGTYHQIGLFLTKIGNLERIITPSNIKMTALSPTIKDPATARVDLLITAFVYKEQ